MKIFNAFQIVCLFAVAPFLIHWLYGSDFVFSQAALWVACAGYVLLFAFIVANVWRNLDD